MKPLIIIYQMGKVASVSLADSLAGRDEFEVVRTHFLTEKSMLRLHSLCEEPSFFLTDIRKGIIKQEKESKAILTIIDNAIMKNRRIFVISGIREPIDYVVSGVFQIYPYFSKPEQLFNPANFLYVINKIIDHDKLSGVFENMLAFIIHSAKYWMQDELLPFFQLKIEDFNPKGIHFEYENIKHCSRFFLYRVEDGIPTIHQELQTWLGVDFNMSESNQAKQKEYSKVYIDFRRDVSLPDEIINWFYKEALENGFYTDEEVQQFSKEWRTLN